MSDTNSSNSESSPALDLLDWVSSPQSASSSQVIEAGPISPEIEFWSPAESSNTASSETVSADVVETEPLFGRRIRKTIIELTGKKA